MNLTGQNIRDSVEIFVGIKSIFYRQMLACFCRDFVLILNVLFGIYTCVLDLDFRLHFCVVLDWFFRRIFRFLCVPWLQCPESPDFEFCVIDFVCPAIFIWTPSQLLFLLLAADCLVTAAVQRIGDVLMRVGAEACGWICLIF